MNSIISPAAGSTGYTGFAPTLADASEISLAFTDRVVELLKQMGGTLSDAQADLGMLSDRVFGSAPTVQSTGSTAPQPSARAELIFDMFDSVQRQAASVAIQARGLNSRI